jgi:hypothetical protein
LLAIFLGLETVNVIKPWMEYRALPLPPLEERDGGAFFVGSFWKAGSSSTQKVLEIDLVVLIVRTMRDREKKYWMN